MMNRRRFLGWSGAMALGAIVPGARGAAGGAPPFKLGLVTYNIASAWDLATILANCREAGIDGVEFRTTHKHGVEPSLDPAARREVKTRCADAGVAIWGLGSACEFHAPDPAIVRANVETCAGFVRLAADLGARGVKVRPNALPKGVPPEKTLAQIGAALVECGRCAADHGVEIWLEMHGRDTQEPANIRAIMDACAHPAVGVCWNSNAPDVKDGSVKASFDLLKDRLRSCHINNLESDYPYRELFTLLRGAGYDRYTLCEHGKQVAPGEGAAFLKAYRRRWLELAGA